MIELSNFGSTERKWAIEKLSLFLKVNRDSRCEAKILSKRDIVELVTLNTRLNIVRDLEENMSYLRQCGWSCWPDIFLYLSSFHIFHLVISVIFTFNSGQGLRPPWLVPSFARSPWARARWFMILRENCSGLYLKLKIFKYAFVKNYSWLVFIWRLITFP